MGLMVIWWLLKRNYWSNCSAGHKSAFCTALIAGGWCTCEAARRNVPNCTLHRSEEHTSELQSLAYLVCRLLLEKKKNILVVRVQQYTYELQSVAYLVRLILVVHTNQHDHQRDSPHSPHS